jgi:hypothetical protein
MFFGHVIGVQIKLDHVAYLTPSGATIVVTRFGSTAAAEWLVTVKIVNDNPGYRLGEFFTSQTLISIAKFQCLTRI